MRLSEHDRGFLGLLALYAGALLSVAWSLACLAGALFIAAAALRVAWWVLSQ